MSRIYEMCNDLDSAELLKDREELTREEKGRLTEFMKREGILSESGKKKNRNTAGRIVGWAAAAAVIALVVVPNTSATAAYAMEQIPILGSVIRAVTIRNYQYESEDYSADIQEVKLEQGNGETAVGTEEDRLEGSIQTINESIEEMTDRLVARFEEQVEQGEGHSSIYADHEVVTNTDTWFTLRIDVTEIAASGFQYQYYYHIDKTTGEIASLKNLFKEGADYITPISENIKKQMREEMRADESKMYWIDSEDEIIEDFETIKEDQNFYLNEEGQIVICFDEYEVAPGYMGLVEFAVDEDAVADIRK
ncbi:MAG: DUF3298 domain-containing protein [Lachnospiraceae bacterium]|nr:DUF3298 domain-containing protein [Lachnospiraceae bacterium]